MNVIFRIASRNLLRHWKRSFAAMLAVAVGVLAISLVRGFVNDLRQFFEDQGRSQSMYGDLLLSKQIPPGTPPSMRWKVALSRDDQALIERVLNGPWGGVQFARRLVIGGLVTNGRTTAVFFGMGYDVQAGAALRGARWVWNTVAGVPLHKAAGERAVVLGRSLAANLGCESSRPPTFLPDGAIKPEPLTLSCDTSRVQLQAMTASGQLNALTVDVAGLIEPGTRAGSSKTLMTDLHTAQTLADTDAVSMYSIALRDRTRARELRAALQDAGKRAGLDLQVKPWRDLPEGGVFRATMALLDTFSMILVVTVGLIGAAAVFNVLTRTVTERIREIGTLRSIGYRRGQIVRLFMLEGVLIAIAGCALGLFLAIGAAAVINASGLSFTGGLASAPLPLMIRLVVGDFAYIVCATIATAALAALLPSRRAGKINTIEALVHT